MSSQGWKKIKDENFREWIRLELFILATLNMSEIIFQKHPLPCCFNSRNTQKKNPNWICCIQHGENKASNIYLKIFLDSFFVPFFFFPPPYVQVDSYFFSVWWTVFFVFICHTLTPMYTNTLCDSLMSFLESTLKGFFLVMFYFCLYLQVTALKGTFFYALNSQPENEFFFCCFPP